MPCYFVEIKYIGEILPKLSTFPLLVRENTILR
jgi:hypothetical protein